MKSASVISVHVSKLKPAKYNPRKKLTPEDPEYQKIKKSIEKFGYVAYIVVNKDLTVIGGHQRLQVMKDIGYSDIEVTQVDLNKQDEKALNLALNKIEGYWDRDLLSELIKDLHDFGYDMDITGFSDVEIGGMLEEVEIPHDIFTAATPKSDTGDMDDDVDSGMDTGDTSKEVTCPHCGECFIA
jgi:ParB-like chromosome segregation protein Spo0J